MKEHIACISLRVLWTCTLPVVLADSPRTQCGEDLVMHAPVPGTSSWVNAMVRWDPDGAGPRNPVVVLGGKFLSAGNVYSPRVATYDPVTGEWGAMGMEFGSAFEGTAALAVLPNGDLVAGSDTYMSGNPAIDFRALSTSCAEQ